MGKGALAPCPPSDLVGTAPTCLCLRRYASSPPARRARRCGRSRHARRCADRRMPMSRRCSRPRPGSGRRRAAIKSQPCSRCRCRRCRSCRRPAMSGAAGANPLGRHPVVDQPGFELVARCRRQFLAEQDSLHGGDHGLRARGVALVAGDGGVQRRLGAVEPGDEVAERAHILRLRPCGPPMVPSMRLPAVLSLHSIAAAQISPSGMPAPA